MTALEQSVAEPRSAAEREAGAEKRPTEPGTSELFRFSFLLCGGSALFVLFAFWVYRTYAWLFPG